MQRSLDRALRESHDDERTEHEAAIERLQTEAGRLQGRIHAAYLDNLDGTAGELGFVPTLVESR